MYKPGFSIESETTFSGKILHVLDLDEFNRLTGCDVLKKFKEPMIGFAERIIRIEYTTDKELLNSFKTKIADSRTKEFKTCRYLNKICSYSIC